MLNFKYYILMALNILVRYTHFKKLSCHRKAAMLRDTEYFSTSLKVIQNDILKEGVCESQLLIHCNYVCILYHF